MFTYLLKRLLEMIPTLIGITLLSFFIIQLAPGKPTDVLADLNPKMTPEARERLTKYYGLDNSIYDRITTMLVFIGFAIPTFWLALLLMILLGVNLHWLPISGLKSLGYENLSAIGKVWDSISHLILPVTLEAFGGLAGLSRYMKSNMLEVIRQDYITTARAKGLSERKVIYKHA